MTAIDEQATDAATWRICMVCGHEQPDDSEPGCDACERGEPVFVRPRAPSRRSPIARPLPAPKHRRIGRW